MKDKISLPIAILGLAAALALFAAAICLGDRIPAPLNGLCFGGGGILVGLAGTALFMNHVGRSWSPEERREIERAETDERNVAIREKAAYTSWFWSLYLLWVPFLVSLLTMEVLFIALSAGVVVLHCVFLMVNINRWAKRL